MLNVIPIADALSLVLEKFGGKTGQVESVGFDRALGRFLGEDIVAQEDVPAFDRSTVDGFAVRKIGRASCRERV